MKRVRWVVAGCVVILGILQAPSSALAQSRFEVLGRQPLAQVPAASILTIRDRETSGCYALLLAQRAPIEPAAAIAESLPPLPIDPGASATAYPAVPASVTPSNVQQWATLPWATPAPGMPTGGWEYLAESMRLALVDPGTAEALSAPLRDKLNELDERLARLEVLFENAVPPASTVWSIPCPAASGK